MMTNMERYTSRLKDMIEDAHDTLEAFRNALAQNAQYAFNFHGDRAAEAAARLDVAIMMQQFVSAGEAELLIHCLKEVTRRARNGSNSTSPLTNQMDRYTAAAYVELAEALQWEPKVRKAVAQ